MSVNVAARALCTPSVGIARKGAGRVVEQQPQQRALRQPQQERSPQQEQQCGLPLREHSPETDQDAAVVGSDDGGWCRGGKRPTVMGGMRRSTTVSERSARAVPG